MSRHRGIRNLNHEEGTCRYHGCLCSVIVEYAIAEYDDYYGSYGHSVDDEIAISPGTAAQYTRRRMDSASLDRTEEEDEDNYDNDLNEAIGESLKIDHLNPLERGTIES